MAYIKIRNEKGEEAVVDYAYYCEVIKPMLKEKMRREHGKEHDR